MWWHCSVFWSSLYKRYPTPLSSQLNRSGAWGKRAAGPSWPSPLTSIVPSPKSLQFPNPVEHSTGSPFGAFQNSKKMSFSCQIWLWHHSPSLHYRTCCIGVKICQRQRPFQSHRKGNLTSTGNPDEPSIKVIPRYLEVLWFFDFETHLMLWSGNAAFSICSLLLRI